MDSTDLLDALALRVRGLASAASGRLVIGIAGSPGAGKSTLAANLVDVLNAGTRDAVPVPVSMDGSVPAGGGAGVAVPVSMDGSVPAGGGAGVAVPVSMDGSVPAGGGAGVPVPVSMDGSVPAGGGAGVAVPMDGFHLANATLDRLGLRDRKGALETFDGWGFLALLTRLRRETAHTVYAPGFDRAVDEPVAGAIAVEPAARIVIVEGNYLLCEGEPWGLVREQLDEAWFCAASENERMSRLTARHIAHGRTRDAAEAWAREVDGANARIIEPTRSRADLVVSGTTGAVVA